MVTCQAYNIQYVGQTKQELRKRHYGHLSDVRNGTEECHGQGKDLKVNENLDICMEPFSLLVVASVRPPATLEEQPACQARLGWRQDGTNIRDENQRWLGL
jgi:hypothetical protein